MKKRYPEEIASCLHALRAANQTSYVTGAIAGVEWAAGTREKPPIEFELYPDWSFWRTVGRFAVIALLTIGIVAAVLIAIAELKAGRV